MHGHLLWSTHQWGQELMRPQRFMDLTMKILAAIDHTEIAGIEPYDAPGHNNPCGIKVTMRDSKTVWLRITATAKDGGDDHSQPETIPFPDWELPSNLRELLANGKERLTPTAAG